MNIWAWVREAKARLGRGGVEGERLAALMGELPSAAVDEAHARVDAMVPEALALARELDEPWVELFIRHWSLQSRVLHRRRAGAELAEAVSLLDFASGARTQPCPQSVCAVQDLAVCYAIRDGPGYVPERLAVARETLDRIDPSWACFDCISAEYFSALVDDDRVEEALAFVDGQIALAAEHGEFELGFNTRLNRSHALVRLGRAQEALALIEGIRNPARYGRSRLMALRQRKLAILLALGRVDEALRLHPPLSAVIDTGAHLRQWVDNLTALIEAGAIANTARCGRELLEIQRRFVDSTAHWDTARTALSSARLAVDRGAREVTRMLLDDLDELLPKLRKPELLSEERREVEARLATLGEIAHKAAPEQAAPEQAAPEQAAPEQVHREGEDPEQALDRLVAAPPRADDRSGGERAVLELARALREVGRSARARTLLEAPGAGQEPTGIVLIELAETLLAEGDHDALEELIAGADAASNEPSDEPVWLQLRWILGQSLRERRELERAVALDLDTLARVPRAAPFELRLATLARELGDWPLALAALERAAELLAPGELDWDRMTVATILGRWDLVRAAASRLKIELPGQGDAPIEANLGLVRCEFIEANGRRERYWARRESPCSARIIEIAMPTDPQHFRDWVVFEPSDLDAHLRAEGRSHRPCFEVVTVLEAGGCRSFLLRGFDPGEAIVDELRQTVRGAGYGFERITSEGRSAADPRVDSPAPEVPTLATPEVPTLATPEVPTLAALVAVASLDDLRPLWELVAELTASWALPLLGPEFDAAVGELEASEQAAALLARWNP